MHNQNHYYKVHATKQMQFSLTSIPLESTKSYFTEIFNKPSDLVAKPTAY